MPVTPLSSATILSKYYRNITDLPLSRFIDIIVDNNLYALIISGHPDDTQLSEAWEDIRIQYAEAMKDNEFKMITSLEKELNIIRITYSQILECIKTLTNFYTKQFADALNKLLKSSFKFDTRFPEDYDNDLKRAYNRSKGIMIDLKMKQDAYDAMKNRFSKNGQEITRGYFQAVLITLSDHVKYQVHDSMTVFEFCDRVRRLNQYFETMKNKK